MPSSASESRFRLRFRFQGPATGDPSSGESWCILPVSDQPFMLVAHHCFRAQILFSSRRSFAKHRLHPHPATRANLTRFCVRDDAACHGSFLIWMVCAEGFFTGFGEP